MRTIATPVPVTAGETVVTFADFVRHFLTYDQRFNSTGVGIRAAARVEAAIESDPVTLEETDYELLAEAVESPQPAQLPNGARVASYPLRPARLCAPFLAAIKCPL